MLITQEKSPADDKIVKRLLEESISANTRRAYASQLLQLRAWLNGRALNDSVLAEYVAWLYKRGRAVATATQAVAACKFEARNAGEADPSGPLTVRALAGFRRDAATSKRGRGAGLGHFRGRGRNDGRRSR